MTLQHRAWCSGRGRHDDGPREVLFPCCFHVWVWGLHVRSPPEEVLPGQERPRLLRCSPAAPAPCSRRSGRLGVSGTQTGRCAGARGCPSVCEKPVVTAFSTWASEARGRNGEWTSFPALIPGFHLGDQSTS